MSWQSRSVVSRGCRRPGRRFLVGSFTQFCGVRYPFSVCSRARRETRRRLVANSFSIAPRHVRIGYTETVIIHSLFALLARHVPAANDASLRAPRIRRRFSDRRRCCAERHSDTEQDERYGRWPDETFEGHDCSICMMHTLNRDMGPIFAVTSSTFS
jgi:hypothetical protein